MATTKTHEHSLNRETREPPLGETREPTNWETEESIPLRVLVQLLVFIAIGATDQLAEKNYSTWAIPLGGMAASWAWYARRQKNIPVKIGIALGMLAALFVFLSDLVQGNDETRILLARLLIQLQVLHSFDLPRRKDLGYSIVIAFILLGVAATLSQTMTFSLWIIAFTALVIPILVLDLRSRLGVISNSWRPQQLGISPGSIVTLLGLVLLLGLVVFFLLPRLPGYQVRTFPVSDQIVQRQAPPGRIIQPQIQQEMQGDGESSGGGGGEGTGEAGSGRGRVRRGLPPLFGEELDATRGVLVRPELVMRVRSQAELFWRVLAYDFYTGTGWKISRSGQEYVQKIKRDALGYRFDVPTNIANLVIPARSRQVIQTYTIVTDAFPNVIPAAAVPTELYFPSDEIEFDPDGNFRAPAPLPKETIYTVISQVARREQDRLRKVRVRYPDSIGKVYLQVPSSLQPQLQTLGEKLLREAASVVSGEPLNIDNAYDAALYLAQYLKQNYRLADLTEQNLDPAQDLVEQFLTQREGNGAQFVSTYVLLLRSLGLPARYMVGFAPGRFNPFTGYYEVMNSDAMAMGEVFFPGYGWLAFNPVPGQPLLPPSVEEDQTFSALKSFWQWVAGFLPSPLVGFLAVVFNQMGKFFGWLVAWLVSLGWLGIFVGVAVLFLLALVGWGIWQFCLWWWDKLRLSLLHPVERTYQLMIRATGMPKPPASTPQEYAQLLSEHLPADLADLVWQITNIYQDWRYGNRTPCSWREMQALLQRLRKLNWRRMSYTQGKV
ncbi:MAG: transglutaminaseTgpA domain-containing protein [Pseudanabaenaceae cyanobacterium SKYGB_i_bin29]|nr:transglutaminaseTgpA domain-containing protein [Pseudanabaenaceae cyanobacterium SKYG29]MDW8420864.1 transglutaminaseTgpA domain-containing protein [Pseudanabaenaceae cyanobacterium SKYGB_i_bin29]